MPLKALTGIKRLPLVEDSRRWVRVTSSAAVAVVSAAAGIGAVQALEPVLARPYIFPAVVAVILSAIVAGAGWGVLTSALFCVGYAKLAVNSPAPGTALVVFFITASLIASICGALRWAYAQLRDEHRLLTKIHDQREDLLRALTHDIRSPLGVITMNAAMIGRTDPEDRRRAGVIQNSIGSIDSMLKDLIEVVALESGTVALERTAVPLPTVVDRVKEDLAGMLSGGRVNVAIPSNLPPVYADPQRLERVLVNVMSNALKYSVGEVALSAAQEERDIVVSVSDYGPGIRPADLPHIFEKYYRASGAASQEGLGLGLYISRLLVEAHGGRIWAESVVGKGTTFSIAIPAARPWGYTDRR